MTVTALKSQRGYNIIFRVAKTTFWSQKYEMKGKKPPLHGKVRGGLYKSGQVYTIQLRLVRLNRNPVVDFQEVGAKVIVVISAEVRMELCHISSH